MAKSVRTFLRAYHGGDSRDSDAAQTNAPAGGNPAKPAGPLALRRSHPAAALVARMRLIHNNPADFAAILNLAEEKPELAVSLVPRN